MDMEKRGLSGVVATIVLVVLTIAAVGIIYSFVIPMVKENLKTSGESLAIMDKVKLNPVYTCYHKSYPQEKDPETGETVRMKDKNGNELPPHTGIIVNLEVGDIELNEVVIVLINEGESKRIRAKDGDAGTEDFNIYREVVCNEECDWGGIIVPEKNQAITYNIPFNLTLLKDGLPDIQEYKYLMSNVDKVGVIPVIDGKEINAGVELNIGECGSDAYDSGFIPDW